MGRAFLRGTTFLLAYRQAIEAVGTETSADWFFLNRELPQKRIGMCHLCEEANKTIEHYRSLARHVIDQRTLDSIAVLIAKLEADKKARHHVINSEN
jgi:hypothetical protein